MVALLAQALMLGMQACGLSHCLKHFPGHGWVQADSHLALPRDARGQRQILRADAAPYGWLRHVARAVMPAHVVYSRVDALPAGFSERWLRQLLREQLGFAGAIISDDLSMQGAREIAATGAQAVRMALQAGCDLALVCNLAQLDAGAALDAILDGLRQAQHDDAWRPDAAAGARRAALLASEPPLVWDDLMRDPGYIGALDDLARLA